MVRGKRVIRKTINGEGNYCKTYILNYRDVIIFQKITLIKKNQFYLGMEDEIERFVGGEVVVKKTDNYILTKHWFSIKKDTLTSALIEFLK